jgi:ferredoxin-NADP reductase
VALTASPTWKEEMVITDEERRSVTFSCGWGVTPAVAYLPSVEAWTAQTPQWLWSRRDEVVAVIRATGHVVEIDGYDSP